MWIKRYQLLSKLGLSPLYLSAGMQRSGSTLMYNYLRIILESKYGDDLQSTWIGDLQQVPTKRCFLIKTHDIGKTLQFRSRQIFYSYRDVRTSMISDMRKFGVEPTFEAASFKINQYVVAKRCASRLVKYENMIAEPEKTIQQLSEALGIDCDPRFVVQRFSQDSREHLSGDEDYSKKTSLHSDHRTFTEDGEWKNVLAPELIELLHHSYGWWFEECGYDC